MYYVIQPIMSTSNPEWINSATIISRHRTSEAAEAKIEKDTRYLRNQPGQANSWLDWYVVDENEVSENHRER